MNISQPNLRSEKFGDDNNNLSQICRAMRLLVFKVALCNFLTGIEENYWRTGEANKRLHKVILLREFLIVKHDMQSTYSVTLRYVRATIVAVEEQ